MTEHALEPRSKSSRAPTSKATRQTLPPADPFRFGSRPHSPCSAPNIRWLPRGSTASPTTHARPRIWSAPVCRLLAGRGREPARGLLECDNLDPDVERECRKITSGGWRLWPLDADWILEASLAQREPL